jgi:hypothetical protein
MFHQTSTVGLAVLLLSLGPSVQAGELTRGDALEGRVGASNPSTSNNDVTSSSRARDIARLFSPQRNGRHDLVPGVERNTAAGTHLLAQTSDRCHLAGRARRAARELARSAEHFHGVAHDYAGYSHLSLDAHRLSEAAEHFYGMARASASCEHIREDFRELARTFRHTREAFANAHRVHHNRHIQHDWEDVEYAFDELRDLMTGHDDHDDGHGGHDDGHDAWGDFTA